MVCNFFTSISSCLKMRHNNKKKKKEIQSVIKHFGVFNIVNRPSKAWAYFLTVKPF